MVTGRGKSKRRENTSSVEQAEGSGGGTNNDGGGSSSSGPYPFEREVGIKQPDPSMNSCAGNAPEPYSFGKLLKLLPPTITNAPPAADNDDLEERGDEAAAAASRCGAK
jgi:hypothetical protein